MTQTDSPFAQTANRQRKILRSRAEIRLSDGTSIPVRTVDINTGGLSLISEQMLEPGATCTIVFPMAVRGALHTVSAEAKVIYNSCQGTQGFRLGIHFQTADPQRAKLIASLY